MTARTGAPRATCASRALGSGATRSSGVARVVSASVLVAMVQALLLACSSAPDLGAVPLHLTVPEDWVAASGSAGGAATGDVIGLRDDWWNALGDPRVDALVREALRFNPDLRATAARLLRADADATIAGADRKPQVDLELQRRRAKNTFIGLPVPGEDGDVLVSRSTQYSLQLGVSWELDVWARLASREAAALAQVGAAEADLAAARLSLSGLVARGWFSLLEAQKQQDLARSIRDSWLDTATFVRARYARGLRSPLDLHIIEANLAGAEAVLDERRRQRDLVARAVEVLLGRYPAAELEAAGEFPALLPPVPAGVPASIVRRRPDLAAAERRLAASEFDVAAAEGDLYPRLALTGTGGGVNDEFEHLLDADFFAWDLVASVVQPIYQGGRLAAAVDRAEAQAAVALESFTASVLAAYAEVEGALTDGASLARQERHVATAFRESMAADRLAQERYERGVTDLLFALETRRDRNASEITLIELQRRRVDARIDLHLALGGGFEAPLEVRDVAFVGRATETETEKAETGAASASDQP